MRTFTLLFFLTVCLSSCQGDGVLPDFLQFNKNSMADKISSGVVTGYTETRDLSYGTDERFHRFDMHKPTFEGNPEPSVAMIMIHGGNWYFLDKGFNDGSIRLLKNKKKNITVFNINLRLTQMKGITYQNQLEDIGQFISFLERNKKVYNLSGDYILWGYSSGGHLALTYSYMNSKNRQIKAVVSVAGPTDLRDESIRNRLYSVYNENLTELVVGRTYQEDPASFAKASPYYYVKRNVTPTMLFYAANDEIVPWFHGELLADQLNKEKNKVSFVKFEKDTHNIESMDESFDRIFDFLKGI